MSYTDLQNLSATEFKRLCGVRRETFNAQGRGAATTSESVKVGGEDRTSYVWKINCWWHWNKAREYRSQFHIATTWGLHETTVGRTIKKVEDLLVKCGKFRLPSKRVLYQPGWEWKVMVVDVGEMEIERPKKNKNDTIVASNIAIRSKRNCW